MKPVALIKSALAGIVCFFFFQQAQANVSLDTIDTYPRAEFSNNNPSAGEKINVQWLLGYYHDSCVPAFATSITKKIVDGVVCYYLNFKETPVAREGIGCLQALTLYGPEFEIGPFDLTGYTYKVYIDTLLVREFRIDSKKYPYPIVTPQDPHEGDKISVQWILGEDSVNCVMQYAGAVTYTSLLKTNPPIHMINVNYRETPVKYFACIPQPTLYGPVFDLGKVEGGEYVIYYDTTVVTKFTVDPQGEEKPEITVTPEQPFEGDSLKFKLILGRGSSSCAPRFSAKFDRTSSVEGIYEYKLTYETIENTNVVCTKDFVPFGPEWIFTDLKAGTHIFRYSESYYYKVFVQKKRQVPDFPYVTIKGTVYEVNNGIETVDKGLRAVTVPQCSVMVVFDNIVIAKKPLYFIDSIANGNDTVAGIAASTVSPIDMFMAITNGKGEYTISNVPSSVLLNRSYTVAVKNGFVGYGTIPDVITKEISSDIILYKLEVFADSAKAMLGGSEDVVSLIRQLGLEKASGVKDHRARTAEKATIVPSLGGFDLINPSKQKLSIAAFSLNGTRVWNQNYSLLTEGKHFFTVPQTSAGVVIVKVQGEQFTQSKVLSITQR
jgi:hypothetical protein